MSEKVKRPAGYYSRAERERRSAEHRARREAAAKRKSDAERTRKMLDVKPAAVRASAATVLGLLPPRSQDRPLQRSVAMHAKDERQRVAYMLRRDRQAAADEVKNAKRQKRAKPTEEQMRHAEFREEDIVDRQPGGRFATIGKAFRKRRMLEILGAQGLFSSAEFKALAHYRHHADMADRSLLRDSLNTYRAGGDGSGPTVEMITAIALVADVERAAGSLVDILRAVIVEDKSLSQWAMDHGGSIEQCRDRKGRTVCTLEPKRKALNVAKLDMQMVAKRVEAELSA